MNSQSSNTSNLIESVVGSLLHPGEELIWCGRPRQGIVLRRIDVVLIPLGLLACCFFGVWSYFAIRYFPIPLKFMSIPAIVFGFYLAYGRFLLDMRRRSNTIYAITNERCLWINNRDLTEVKTLDHQSMPETTLVKLGSVGTIAFGPKNGLGLMYGRAMGIREINSAADEFERIEDAERIHNILRALSLGMTPGLG